MKVVNIHDLIKGDQVKIQVGVDKNGTPVYLGDTVYQDIEEWLSPDYWNGYDSRARYTPPSPKELHKGRVYRKVEFDGSSFILNRVKEEGSIPKGTSGEVWASQRFLLEYVKVE